MDPFNASQPIFLQIRQRLIEMILSNRVGEGEPLPSVRQISADLSVNPLTVTKAFEALVDLGVVEKRRGLGMFVAEGARGRLLEHERRAFLEEEWPRVRARLLALGLSLSALLENEAPHDQVQGDNHE